MNPVQLNGIFFGNIFSFIILFEIEKLKNRYHAFTYFISPYFIIRHDNCPG
jgi:hypothetical protein